MSVESEANSFIWFNKTRLETLVQNLEKTYGVFEELQLIEERIRLLNKIREFSPFIQDKIENENIELKFEHIDHCKEVLRTSLKAENLPISALIITLNEERCIERCIDSIVDKVDEIIVVDTGSTDRTVEIIEEYEKAHVKLFHYEWTDSFADARNYALDKAKTPWIFYIDADEYLDESVDKEELFNTINLFNHFPLKNSIVLSPSITNHNEDNLLTVKRIFFKESTIKYYGYVHEEPRKEIHQLGKDVYNISVDIELNHDGYREEVSEQKDKGARNVRLLKKMIELEPNHPRWKFFLIRDSGSNFLTIEEMEFMIKEAVLIDLKNDIDLDNIQFHEFTFALLDLYTELKLVEKKYDEVQQFSELLNALVPNNSNSIYYSNLSKVLKNKEEMLNILLQTMAYRDKHFDLQHGMLHSNGYHIDFLLGILLFETGMYEKSLRYFEFLETKFLDQNVLSMYENFLTIMEEKER